MHPLGPSLEPVDHKPCYHDSVSSEISMKPLIYLANAFINTFGITQPTPEAAERTARILAFMMLAVILAVIIVAVVVVRAIYH